MVVGEQFPMFRLATLLLRQMSSPVASRIKRYALSNPVFGERVCRSCARAYLSAEWATRRLALRLGGAVLPAMSLPPPVSDRRAVDLGGDLLGEIIIFSLGASIVIFEVNRQATKQESKKLDEKSRWLAVRLSLEELQHELVLQQADIERLHAALKELDI